MINPPSSRRFLYKQNTSSLNFTTNKHYQCQNNRQSTPETHKVYFLIKMLLTRTTTPNSIGD